VRTVALNAGVGAGGAFASDTTLEDELRIVDLNVRSMGPSRQAIANRQLRCNAAAIDLASPSPPALHTSPKAGLHAALASLRHEVAESRYALRKARWR